MKQELDRRLVAIMFTDMVGYTALIEINERDAIEKRDRYVRSVELHHERFGGAIVQRLGDGTLSMFPSSLAAVHGAVEIQRELGQAGVPVRIGIHIGEVIVEPERLTGDAVNVASRIESFAVAGAVMLSDVARDQLKNQGDVAMVSMGRFRLKNVGRPFELFAVSADGIVMPDTRELAGKGERFASLPSNLPEPGTSLVGRAADVDALVALVRRHRVLTITGPGGVGKTRIVIEVARILAPEFLDGVTFVPLADVPAPEDFVPALATALDVKEAEGRTLGEGIISLIGDKKALLLLDNFEQLVLAGTELARLVEACPRLRIVTSSRTPLRIAPEREYPLAPLGIPQPHDPDGYMTLIDYPAVALFVERAKASKTGFELTPENAIAVAAVCQRLDGLPLAIELAAARLRLLSPDALLARLDQALNVLTSGPRDAPKRQQTLRAAIDWSHSLLTESEQRVFRRMAVFVGGGTFADVEAVCATPGESSLDDVESLVDKARVQVDGQGDRLRMLRTIGEFASERLEAADELGAIALRHARHFGSVARGIRDGIEGDDLVGSLQRGIAEEGNLHAALETLAAATKGGDAQSHEAGLQLCGDLWMYWHIRGKNVTAQQYASAFLDTRTADPTVGRAGALCAAALSSWALGQFARSKDEYAEAYRIAAALNADRERCIAAFCWGFGLIGFDLEEGRRRTSEGIQRAQNLGFTWAEGFALTADGILHVIADHIDTARTRFEEALEIQQRIRDLNGAGLSLSGLAGLAARRGDLYLAIELYGQSLSAYEAIGDRAEQARILAEIASTHLAAGHSRSARRHFLSSVDAYMDVASVRGVGLSLLGLAAVESVEEQPERALQIAAAAEVYAQQEGIVNVYSEQTAGREFVDRARASLPKERIAKAEKIGRRLTIKQALELAGAREGDSM